MGYIKQEFKDGQKLKADHLNYIEDGIKSINWETLEGKPFGEEVEEIVIFEEQDIVSDGSTMSNYPCNTFDSLPFELVEGKEYTVKWNGEEYKCIAQFTDEDEDNGTYLYLGNPWHLDNVFSDNSMPFGIGYRPFNSDSSRANTMFIGGGTYGVGAGETRTIGITTVGTVITPIDEKYIPESVKGGGLFVVNFSSEEGSTTGSTWTADKTYDEIAEAINNGLFVFGLYKTDDQDVLFSLEGRNSESFEFINSYYMTDTIFIGRIQVYSTGSLEFNRYTFYSGSAPSPV